MGRKILMFGFLLSCIFVLISVEGIRAANCPPTNNIVCGDYVQCDFTIPGEADLFYFPGETGDRIRLQVTDSSSPCGWAVDPKVELRDPDGNVIYSGSTCSLYILRSDPLPKSGQYVIIVNGGLGTYALSLECLSNPVGDPVKYGEHVSDQIESLGVVDFFTFYGCSGDLIRLQVTDSSSPCGWAVDPKVEISDPAGNLIVSGSDCSIVTLTPTLLSEGTHSFLVYGGTANYDVDLNVIVGGACIPHWLQADVILNASSFVVGEELIASIRIVNGAEPATVEAKVWIEAPNGILISKKNLAKITIPANSDNIYEILRHTFKVSDWKGTYRVGGHLINPITGKTMTLDQEQLILN